MRWVAIFDDDERRDSIRKELPDEHEWAESCARMLAAGLRSVSSYNPYWDVHGTTFEDVNGYRVVLHNAAWTR